MKIIGRVSALILAASFSLGLACAAQAATYDAFTSFDGSLSQAGPFSFVSFDPATNVTAPLGAGNCAAYIGDTVCQGNLPGIYKTTAGAHQSGTVLVPADKLILHPGDGLNGLLAAIIFTAPQDSYYTFTLSAAQSDTNPHSQTAYIAADLGSGFFQLVSQTLTTANPFGNWSGTGFLAAGQKVALAISNDNGSYYNDSTAVGFSVQAVPEAATWAMMIGGFGAAGASLRRRRTVLVLRTA
jgi:hypothetical protein